MRRVILQIDLDLDERQTEIWTRGLATVMANSNELMEPIIDTEILDVQELDNPAKVSLDEVLAGGGPRRGQTRDIRGPLITRTDPETGQEYVGPIGEIEKGKEKP